MPQHGEAQGDGLPDVVGHIFHRTENGLRQETTAWVCAAEREAAEGPIQFCRVGSLRGSFPHKRSAAAEDLLKREQSSPTGCIQQGEAQGSAGREQDLASALSLPVSFEVHADLLRFAAM